MMREPGEPECAERLTASGGDATHIIWSALLVALVPPGVVTVTSAVDCGWPGVNTVMCRSSLTVKQPADPVPVGQAKVFSATVAFEVEPNGLGVVPVRPVPEMIGWWPPLAVHLPPGV